MKRNVVHDHEVGVREEETLRDIEKYKGEVREVLNEKWGLVEVNVRGDDSNLVVVKNNLQAQADLNCGSC